MNNLIKILYVDDEPINLMLFENMFNKKYKVITAVSGFEGLEILKKNADTKVVISDMKMPGMNGLEFIAKVKPLYPQIHFYILSGYDLTEDIQKSLSSGLILKYFQKPFKMAEIDETIEEAMK